MLLSLGFTQGESCPNVFWHAAKDICCSVHGDDFTSSGARPTLDWMGAEIAKHYEITVQPRMGPGPNDAKEGRSLNRVVRWLEGRIEYEADPRQSERLISECGLDGSKGVATPGVKPTFTELEADTELATKLHTAFRGSAARGNYLAADRIDAQFACKEVCRWMSRPTEHAWQALKRVARFFRSAPRLVYTYPQQTVRGIDVYTDTDWAGCPKTRKSTSGGSLMLGCHTIKHWSSTQTSVALSSGEAEFAGVIRGAGQGLGYQALLKDLGIEAPLRVWTDSSAAIGICSRQGLGKLRHLDTHTLWIQQAVRLGRVDLRKVDGEVNPADLLTKHSLSRERLEALVKLHGCEYIGGRAESAPQARSGTSSKTTMASAASGTSVVGTVDSAERPPIMPHNCMSENDLDREYPSIVAPEDEHLDDIANDDEDHVLQAGLREVEKIRQTMKTQGRRRRPLRDDSTHGTLSLCVETTKPATTAATTTTAVSCKTALGPTTTTAPKSEVEQACAERADAAFGNDVAPLGECNAPRVRRLASIGGAWQRPARLTRRDTTTTTTTTTTSTLRSRLDSENEAVFEESTCRPATWRRASTHGQGRLQKENRNPRANDKPLDFCDLIPKDSRGGPPVAWKYRYQVSSPISRLCPCSTVAGLKTGMQESKELYPSARWMADPGRRARHPVQGSNTVLSDGEILASVVRLSYEATTSSTLCRRRSVWQEGLTDTATTTTSAMSTPSDKLACGQRYDVDIGQTEYMGSDATSDATVSSPCESLLLPLFYLSRMCDSGSSALFLRNQLPIDT
jgi:hypothetical protein